jgi:diacylglycerol kinase (ATP)
MFETPQKNLDSSRLLALRNPASGKDNDGFDAYLQALRARGAEVIVRELNHQTPLEKLLEDGNSFSRVIAAGGDGTVSSVAHALAGSGIPIMVYPAGTANLVALNLELPSDPLGLANLTLDGEVIDTDLAELRFADGVVLGFALNAGAGLDAHIVADSEALKSKLGVGAYLASALQNTNPTIASISLQLDGRKIETEGIGVMVVNHGRLQLGLELAPNADASDGKLEVVVIRATSLAGLVPVVLGSLLTKFGFDAPDLSGRLEVYTAARVRVTSEPPLPVQYDGESTEHSTPFEAHVLPLVVRFIADRTAV